MRLFAVGFVFIAFTAYTLFVMAGNGVFGFVSLASHEPWGLQLFLDLLVMLTLFSLWIFQDAKERKLPMWPYIVLTLLTGSMGALAYLVHREFTSRRIAQDPHLPQGR